MSDGDVVERVRSYFEVHKDLQPKKARLMSAASLERLETAFLARKSGEWRLRRAGCTNNKIIIYTCKL